MEMTRTVVVKDCDLCKAEGHTSPAMYDDKTILGPWAYLCAAHQKRCGMGIGFILRQKSPERPADADVDGAVNFPG